MARPKKQQLNPNEEGFGEDIDNEDLEGTSAGMSDAQLKKFSKEYSSLKSKMDDARSPVGTLFKEFEEKGGHKAAFKIAHKIADMESLKAQDFWRSLGHYLTVLGVFDQHDLIEHAEAKTKNEAKESSKSVSAAGGIAAVH
ncbi:MAG: hypothetical protein KGL39_49305 [Patescibacteria group bacterium]|nr:hypothetical protein [Patescibacteria group bacterium]